MGWFGHEPPTSVRPPLRLVHSAGPVDVASAFASLWNDLRGAEIAGNFEAVGKAREALDALYDIASRRGPQPPGGA